jgi:hypothetical protein
MIRDERPKQLLTALKCLRNSIEVGRKQKMSREQICGNAIVAIDSIIIIAEKLGGSDAEPRTNTPPV